MPQPGTSFYKKEVFPDNILFMKDTPANRDLIKELLGEAAYSLGNTAFIKIDTEKKDWIGCPDFEWLYRDSPPLHSIEEIKSKL